MPALSLLLGALESLAPAAYAMDWDKVGLHVGDPGQEVTKAIISLDHSWQALKRAEEIGAELVITHHPLFFSAIERLDGSSEIAKKALYLASKGIALASAHTNWDAAPGGINDALAAVLGIINVKPFGGAAKTEVFKLVTTVPVESADTVLEALGKAGAGRIGNYDGCSFSQTGEGRFRPLEGANPAIGSVGNLEAVSEARIEVDVASQDISGVIAALRAAHPYEEPTIDLYPLRSKDQHPIGRIGALGQALTLQDFAAHVDRLLGTKSLVWGTSGARIDRVALIGGGADSEWKTARKAGAQVFVTGEVRHHIALEIADQGFCAISAGHYATEQPGMVALKDALAAKVPEVSWHLFEPNAGEGGRPN